MMIPLMMILSRVLKQDRGTQSTWFLLCWSFLGCWKKGHS
jgi:hypothetical protein